MTAAIALLVLMVGAARATEPPPVPPPLPPVPPIVWTGALAGGAPVAVLARHGLPLVRVELSFDTTPLRASLPPGALDALGAAWAADVDAADTRDTLERLGADVSIGCGAVRCWAALEVPGEGLPAALARLAELVRSPRLEAGAFARWRRGARGEWKTDWLGPGIVHTRALGRLTWPDGHPYRLDRSGAAFRVRITTVRTAFRAVVSDATASVVVAGDVLPSSVLPLLEAAFGGLGGRAEALPVAPPAATGRHVVVDAPGANQAIVSVAWRSPTEVDADRDAYTLAFQALAGGFASRLNLRLREEEGLTYRVDGSYAAEAGYGWSEVELATEPSRVATVLAILAEELERARTGGFTEAEVSAARHQAWVQGAVETSTLAGLARMVWRDRRAGRPPGAAVTHLGTLRDVSPAAVSAAAAVWLAEPRTWLVSGDSDTLEPVLEEAGWPTGTVWGACQAVYGGPCPR